MSSPVVLRDLTYSYPEAPDRAILDGIDLNAAPGERVGVIGENGSGKSTLVRIIAGLLSPDGGSVSVPADLGYLAQDSGIEAGATVAEVMAAARAPLHQGVARLEELAARLGEAEQTALDYDRQLAWVTSHDAWDADRRAAIAAQRLGLGAVPPDRDVSELSGGQRSRLALAALLIRRPEALVLDEPTNHLDDEALEFLETELLASSGVLLVASHDRVSLDRVCTRLVDLDPMALGTDGHGGRTFSGGYSSYLATKQDSRRRWQEAFEAQQEELDDLRSKTRTTLSDIAHARGPRDNDKFIHHFKGQNVQATQRRRIRDAERRIEEIERHRIPKPPAPLVFSGGFVARVRGETASVTARDLCVEGRLELERLDVAPGEHVLVTGANGSGKSTLLTAVAGEIAYDSGHLEVHARRIGYLPQDVSFADPSLSSEQVFAARSPEADLHALGLLRPADTRRPVGMLSQGQRQRLGLALLMSRQHDLVLLDEPTNHLSLTLVTDLESALAQTPATVLVASHDRWLRRTFSGREVRLP
ncbi:ABC-F family ATP-binding cassette domain-containing protein [Dermacoccaceae bacterium W4C1]